MIFYFYSFVILIVGFGEGDVCFCFFGFFTLIKYKDGQHGIQLYLLMLFHSSPLDGVIVNYKVGANQAVFVHHSATSWNLCHLPAK